MKLTYFFFLILFTFLNINSMITNFFPEKNCLQKAIICKPVVDLRIKPKESSTYFDYPILSHANPLQDSQLLFGEHVGIIKQKNGWLKVKALEQPKFSVKKNSWDYQTGWIKRDQVIFVDNFPENNLVVKSQWAQILSRYNKIAKIPLFCVSIGTKLFATSFDDPWYEIIFPTRQIRWIHKDHVNILQKINSEKINCLRKKLIETALTFKETPYLWGGRSAYKSTMQFQQTGVNCSGFVNLVYGANGLTIPRDAHDQFLFAKKIPAKKLKPGDLIFFENKNIGKVTHVAMYFGDENVMESTGKLFIGKNRIISWNQMLKERTNEKISFGSVLLNYYKIQNMR